MLMGKTAMDKKSYLRGRHRSWNRRPPAAANRNCASSLEWLVPLRLLPKKAEKPAPDTLDETLVEQVVHGDFILNYIAILVVLEPECRDED